MQTQTPQQTGSVRKDPETTVTERPTSNELGTDVTRLATEEQAALDRRRQEELARRRPVQSFD